MVGKRTLFSAVLDPVPPNFVPVVVSRAVKTRDVLLLQEEELPLMTGSFMSLSQTLDFSLKKGKERIRYFLQPQLWTTSVIPKKTGQLPIVLLHMLQ